MIIVKTCRHGEDAYVKMKKRSKEKTWTPKVSVLYDSSDKKLHPTNKGKKVLGRSQRWSYWWLISVSKRFFFWYFMIVIVRKKGDTWYICTKSAFLRKGCGWSPASKFPCLEGFLSELVKKTDPQRTQSEPHRPPLSTKPWACGWKSRERAPPHSW